MRCRSGSSDDVCKSGDPQDGHFEISQKSRICNCSIGEFIQSFFGSASVGGDSVLDLARLASSLYSQHCQGLSSATRSARVAPLLAPAPPPPRSAPAAAQQPPDEACWWLCPPPRTPSARPRSPV